MAVVYKIINVVNSKFYVGSAKCSRSRFQQHRGKLRLGKHHCPHLQASWNKHGESAFVFAVVSEHETRDEAYDAEQKWLDNHGRDSLCYNSGLVARHVTRQPGFTHGEETRKKIGDTQRGCVRSDEFKEKVKQGLRRTRGIPVKEITSGRTWPSAADCREDIGISNTTLQRALTSQQPVTKGPFKGLWFVDDVDDPVREIRARKPRPKPVCAGQPNKEKRIVATDPSGKEHAYRSFAEMRRQTGLGISTVSRALKDGRALKRGKWKGWSFRYIEDAEANQCQSGS